MKHSLILCLLFAGLILPGAVDWAEAAPVEKTAVMKRQVGDQRLTYLLQGPTGQKPAAGWPLLLFLHGYGECGDDIEKVKVHGPPKLREQFEQLSGCLIVSPQCPRNSWWRVETLKALVEEVIAERGDIDRKRLYVTGLSMGGYGTWSLVARYPDYFAAAIPICGGGDPFRLPQNKPSKKIGIKNEFDPENLARAVRLPIWTFHGTLDKSVPLRETKLLVSILENAGSKKIRFTEYQEAGHVAAWRKAYGDAKTWQWLFAQ